MPRHLQRDLDLLKKKLLNLGTLVEEAINEAIQALVHRRPELAESVIDKDRQVDYLEVEIEEDCLKILALHQPVAKDLRFIVAALKVNNDLERMGDLAANIAKRATYLSRKPPLGEELGLQQMAEKVHAMVRNSLESVVTLDTELAESILRADDEVDDCHAAMYKIISRIMNNDPRAIKRAIHYLSASRYLERIADLATNIAEDLIFMVSGEVIRHKFDSVPDDEDQDDESVSNS